MGGLYALVSAGGSPGVTTAAVALALSWPAPVIVAECDPSGGDILAGLLSGHVPAGNGLMEYAIEAGRSGGAAALSQCAQLIPLDDDRTRMVLPGLTDPRQAGGLASAWPAVAAAFAAQPADVIADCGRFDVGPGQPLAVLSAAWTVGIVLRPTLRQVWSARPRVEMLSELLGGRSRLTLLLTGPGTRSAREVAHALSLPVAAVLPADSRTASLLSDGVGGQRQLGSGPLMRSARAAGRALCDRATVMSGQPADGGLVR
ncbi:MAG TPA: hypothetical protein VMA73_30980 [Streptosporangiaceae bacterium]|nr:hypothetical protein [Streptosporangiaceae bacterium]